MTHAIQIIKNLLVLVEHARFDGLSATGARNLAAAVAEADAFLKKNEEPEQDEEDGTEE